MSNSEMKHPHIETQEALEQRILSVIDEVDKGFRRVMEMYRIAFYMGLLLILMGFIGSMFWKENLFLPLFGAVGLLDVVAFFIYKPVEDLQRSRGNLAQLISAFLTWYNDTHNWNQILKKELEKDDSDVRVCKDISQTSVLNTVVIMSAIELFVASKTNKEAKEKFTSIIKELQDRQHSYEKPV